MSRIGKSIEIESRLVLNRTWEERGIRTKGLVGAGLLCDENVLELDSGGGCTTL